MEMIFDPRTKLALMIFTVIVASQSPSLEYECILIAIIMLFGILLGKRKYSIIGAVVFGMVYLVTVFYIRNHSATIYTMLIAWLSLMFQVYPCGMLAGIVVSTTKVNEFLYAMHKMRLSPKMGVSFAIMLRYFPVISEDWQQIKDAMRMKNLEPSFWGFLKNPALTVECIYVPMLMAASKAADELTIASVTRGIENPKQRTCLLKIGFRVQDIISIVMFGALSIGCFIF